MRDKPVTIRLLDIGGDKPLPFLRLPTTLNPVLGRRGVRVLLEYSQLVRTQMGAILRLSQEYPVRMLVPMITLEEDIKKMRETFDKAWELVRPPFERVQINYEGKMLDGYFRKPNGPADRSLIGSGIGSLPGAGPGA